MRLKELVKKIRSKNAGPFLLTIDIFCSNKKTFETIIQKITKIEISAKIANFQQFLTKELRLENFSIVDSKTVQRSAFCRSRRELSNEYSFANICLRYSRERGL